MLVPEPTLGLRRALAPRDEKISKFVEASLQKIALPPDTRILDIPCGYGRHTRWLAKNRYFVTGLDVDERRVSQARAFSGTEDARIVWAVADAERPLPLQYGSF